MTPFISARISYRQQRTGAWEEPKELVRRGCVSHTVVCHTHCPPGALWGGPTVAAEINDGDWYSGWCELMHDQTRIILEHSGTILSCCIRWSLCICIFFRFSYLCVLCLLDNFSFLFALTWSRSYLNGIHGLSKDPHQDGMIVESKMLPWRLYSCTLNGGSFYTPGNNGSSTASGPPPQSRKLLRLILCLSHVLRVLAKVPATKETFRCSR